MGNSNAFRCIPTMEGIPRTLMGSAKDVTNTSAMAMFRRNELRTCRSCLFRRIAPIEARFPTVPKTLIAVPMRR